MPHAVGGVRADSKLRAMIRERTSEALVARAHDGDDTVDASDEIAERTHAERYAVLERCEQLVATEARSAAGGKEDADDRIAGRRRGHSGSRRNLPSLTMTSTRARSSMPLWLVGLILNTPWQPVISLCCSSASRSAMRNASVPGLAVLSAMG